MRLTTPTDCDRVWDALQSAGRRGVHSFDLREVIHTGNPSQRIADLEEKYECEIPRRREKRGKRWGTRYFAPTRINVPPEERRVHPPAALAAGPELEAEQEDPPLEVTEIVHFRDRAGRDVGTFVRWGDQPELERVAPGRVGDLILEAAEANGVEPVIRLTESPGAARSAGGPETQAA